MRVAIVDKTGELNAAERARLRRRLRFLLTRYAGGLQAVRLVIDRESQGASNGPSCRGVVTLGDGRRSEAEDRGHPAFVSATRVADRLGRAVARLIECKQTSGRRFVGRTY